MQLVHADTLTGRRQTPLSVGRGRLAVAVLGLGGEDEPLGARVVGNMEPRPRARSGRAPVLPGAGLHTSQVAGVPVARIAATAAPSSHVPSTGATSAKTVDSVVATMTSRPPVAATSSHSGTGGEQPVQRRKLLGLAAHRDQPQP